MRQGGVGITLCYDVVDVHHRVAVQSNHLHLLTMLHRGASCLLRWCDIACSHGVGRCHSRQSRPMPTRGGEGGRFEAGGFVTSSHG